MVNAFVGMEVNQQMLDFTLTKIAKPSYRIIRNTLKSYSSRFNHLQEDSDLKKISTVQAQEII